MISTSHSPLRRFCAIVVALLLSGLPSVALCSAQEPEEDLMAVMGPSRIYADASQLPNAVNYLPAPPDTTDAMFANDFMHWLWGKSVRGTSRGTQASNESQYGLNRLAIMLGPTIGVSMSSVRTPKMLALIYNVGETASRSTQYAKMAYMRRRPFEQMGEHTWGRYDKEDELRGNGSYPSAHSAFGWGVGLVFAEMIPERQDTILRRTYMYGESRVIVGAHWQSDVEAARLTASAAVAYMHRDSTFREQFEAARQEYYSLLGTTPDQSSVGMPQGKRIMEAAVDSVSNYYFSDVAQYWSAKEERDSERGEQAIADEACTTTDDLLEVFGEVVGERFSDMLTPAVYDVVNTGRSMMCEAIAHLQGVTPKRKRPYVQVGEPPLVTDVDSAFTAMSSYPSLTATLGWGTALLLTEIIPEKKDQILRRGFELGRSGVITGTEYASDVQAGRTLACAVVARMHADTVGREMIQRAYLEREDNQIVTDINDLLEASRAQPDAWYSISGCCLPSEPTESGIFIHNGEKVIK